MYHTSRKYLLTLILVALLLVGGLIYWRFVVADKAESLYPVTDGIDEPPVLEDAAPNLEPPIDESIALDQPLVEEDTDPSQSDSVSAPDDDGKPADLPAQTVISVPFTSQAPFGVWDELHNEACEEAALLMVKYYRDGKRFDRNTADREITAMVEHETENNYAMDVTLAQLNQIAKNHLNLVTGRIMINPTVDQIKSELVKNRPVIIGAAGKQLGNPNFRNGGPNYHMLVIKGYDEEGFITNDPGTKNGESYKYTYEVLMNAIHDWNPTNITQGQKNYMVFD